MNHLKKMQIILLVIVLNFFFVFSSYANDSRKGLNCLDYFIDARTMLHTAVERGEIGIIASYLYHGGDINLKNSKRRNGFRDSR